MSDNKYNGHYMSRNRYNKKVYELVRSYLPQEVVEANSPFIKNLVDIYIIAYFPDRKLQDTDNLVTKPWVDAVAGAGDREAAGWVLQDDSNEYVRHVIPECLYDKGNGRIEMHFMPVQIQMDAFEGQELSEPVKLFGLGPAEDSGWGAVYEENGM